MEIKYPIIIIGTGRCGSTIFHEILSRHPRVAWLSGLLDKYPDKPFINRWILHSMDIPGIRNLISKRLKPRECYQYWEHLHTGFSEPCRDIGKHDVRFDSITRIHQSMGNLMTKKRDRLLIKLTGWPRTGFLKEIFPDAKFIHIMRDGRAVTHSLLNVAFWSGWKGPQNWRWGMLSNEFQELWKKYDRSFVILAAMEWVIQMKAIEVATSMLDPTEIIELKYEDLIANPIVTFREVCDHTNLEWTVDFEKTIRGYRLKNMNTKWEQNLPDSQKVILNEFLEEMLHKHGY